MSFGTKMSDNLAADPYALAFKGSFTSALRWHHLDDLWEVLRNDPQDWFIYAIGEQPPTETVQQEKFHEFLNQVDQLLRQEHQEDYCGIVYADDLKSPNMVKIYDPNNLGVSCGYSDNPPLPGWVLSRLQPIDLQSDQLVPKNRKRWWQKLFAS